MRASFFVPPRVAYTPQVPRLFSGSVRENILLGLREEDVVLELADQIVVLERGRVEAVGSLEALLRESREMRRLFEA